MVAEPCLRFRAGRCTRAASCKFLHEGEVSVSLERPPNRCLLVMGFPVSTTEAGISAFFSQEIGPLSGCEGPDVGTDGVTALLGSTPMVVDSDIVGDASTGKKPARGVRLFNRGVCAPFAFVTFHEGTSPEIAVRAVERYAEGCLIDGVMCAVKLRKEPKAHRLDEIASNIAKKVAKAEAKAAKRPAWQWEMLDHFPRRATTLDQHTQVSQLPAALLKMVHIYLAYRFPSSTPEIALALQWIWENHPTSLRVKELFETLEVFSLVAQEIALIRSRAANEVCLPCQDNVIGGWSGVDTIFDMACGHGLLGILFAYRFPMVRVVCIDLERRPCFDHYVAAFRAHGWSHVDLPESAGQELMQNLEFVEGDMASAEVPPRSFVVCVHACNEANKTAVEMACRAGAGYAAMPCCIPDGLYSVRGIRNLDVDARYAAMVGVMAGTFAAHMIAGIDRRITNRHMALFGGYPSETKVRTFGQGGKRDDGDNELPRQTRGGGFAAAKR